MLLHIERDLGSWFDAYAHAFCAVCTENWTNGLFAFVDRKIQYHI